MRGTNFKIMLSSSKSLKASKDGHLSSQIYYILCFSHIYVPKILCVYFGVILREGEDGRRGGGKIMTPSSARIGRIFNSLIARKNTSN